MIQIPESIYQKIIEHARRKDPIECCGILAGKDQLVLRSFEIKNVEESPVRYLMDPQEQLTAFEEMRNSSMEMIAIYHSHPRTIPFPSEVDVRKASIADMPLVIVSLKEADNPIVKGFRIRKEAIYLENIEVFKKTLEDKG